MLLIYQGTIIKRHRISKPVPNEHLYYTVHDFNVGTEFVAYGKTFRIVSCDQFTSNFLRKLGIKLGKPESIPDDPYSIHRKAVSRLGVYFVLINLSCKNGKLYYFYYITICYIKTLLSTCN